MVEESSILPARQRMHQRSTLLCLQLNLLNREGCIREQPSMVQHPLILGIHGVQLLKLISFPCNLDDLTEKIMCEIMPKPSTSPGKAKAAVAKLVGSEARNTAKREDKEGYLEGLLLSLLSHAHEMSLAELKQVDEDAKLYWDCAEESVARKRRHRDLCGHPLLPACSRSSSADDAAMDKLVGEISRGMRRLASYGEKDEEVASTDGLYVRLERDLRCGDGWLNAMWDLGWRNGICVEEVDGVVGQVEDRVMSALLEEVAVELKY